MGFLTTLAGVLNSIYIPNIHIKDVLEIAILIFTLYKVIVHITNTRAMVVIQGLLTMFAVYVVAYLLNFNAILVIFQNLMTVCMFAIVLMFQPDLRKLVESLGAGKTVHISQVLQYFNKKEKRALRYSDRTIEQIADACAKMGSVKTGALIVFEMDIPLTEQITSGIEVNADVSSALLINIFEKNTPLHDGAVIMHGDKVISATCYLPLTANANVNKDLGTRHRAALGISENSDCFVITVSEETGKISFIKNGVIKHGITPEKLKKEMKAYQYDNVVPDKKLDNPLKRLKHNLSYKVISFIVGLVGWVLLMNIYNPVYTETFMSIPITVTGEESLTAIGKTYDITEKFVDVAVTSTRREVEKLKNDDINVYADLTCMNLTNAIELRIDIPSLVDKQTHIIGDKFVHVDIDDLVTQTFDVKPVVHLNDDIADVKSLGSAVSSVKNVTISGGSKILSIIGDVRAIYSVTTDLTDITVEVPLTVYDKNGADITKDIKNMSSSTTELTVSLNNSKQVHLNIEPTEVNFRPDYSVWKIKYAPQYLTLTGEENILANVSEITVPLALDMNKIQIKDNEYSTSIDIANYIPTGLTCLDDSTIVDVTIIFSIFETMNIGVNVKDIDIRNLPPNTQLIFGSSTATLTVKCAASDVGNVTIANMKPYIDLSNKTVGKYNIAISYDNKTVNIVHPGDVSFDIISTLPKEEEPVKQEPVVEPVTEPTQTPTSEDNKTDEPKHGEDITPPEEKKEETATDKQGT